MQQVCRTWSMTADRRFQYLCGMLLTAETGTKTNQCEVCAIPVPDYVLCNACSVYPPLMYKVTISMVLNGTVFAPGSGCGSSYNGAFILYQNGLPGSQYCTYSSRERAKLVYCDVPFNCDDPAILALAADTGTVLSPGPGHDPSLHWRVFLTLSKVEFPAGSNRFVTRYTVSAQWFRFQSGFGSSSVIQHQAQSQGNGTSLDCWEPEVNLPFLGASAGGGGFSQAATPFGCGLFPTTVSMTAVIRPLGTRP